MKYYSILLLGLFHFFSNPINSQTVNVVTDSVYNGSTLLYTLTATTTATANNVNISVDISAESGYDINNISSITVNSDTDATHSGRTTLTTMSANGSGNYTYDDVTATDSPLFYSLKVNTNEGGQLSLTPKRSYPAIYLATAPTETITHSFTDTDLITKVYPSETDNTAILAIEIVNDTYFYTVLQSTGVSPYYPAGSKPLFIQNIYADSDNVAGGRVSIGNENVYWGAPGITYVKVTLPKEKIDAVTGYTYLWYKNGRPSFDTNSVGGAIPVYLKSEHTTLGLNDTTKETLKIYPNPSSSALSIKSEKRIDNIQLIDANGRLLLSEVGNGTKEMVLDVSSQLRGLCLLKVTSDNSTLLKNVILK